MTPRPWATFNTNIAGTREISLTALVQAWVDGTYPNNGILLLSSGSNGTAAFTSREAASNQPTLVVEYNELGISSLDVVDTAVNKPQTIFLPVIIK